MSLPKSYLTSSKNLKPILDAIKGAQAPERFTINFLETLGYKSSSDRLIIGVLKSIGFLDSDGKPTERYYRFLDQTQSEIVLAEGIRFAFADLFQINTNANKLSRIELINKFKTLSQGQLSDSVLEKLALTFIELSKLANFSAISHSSDDEGRTSATTEHSDHTNSNGSKLFSRQSKNIEMGGLHYNIQIILPTTRDTKVYDAIFKSLRDHLV